MNIITTVTSAVTIEKSKQHNNQIYNSNNTIIIII
jgi:hypothetical protein